MGNEGTPHSDSKEALHEQCLAVVETARVFILYYTVDGIITYMNAYAERLGGYSRDECIGMSFYDLYVPERIRSTVKAEIEKVIVGTISENAYVGPMLTKSGEERHLLWSGCRTLGPDGKPSGIVASGVDVTEYIELRDSLARSEGLYRDLIDHSLAGIFIVQDGKFVFANKRAEEIAGYTLEEFADKTAMSLVHPDDRPLVAERMARRLAGEDVPARYEYRLVNRDGEARTAEIWSTVIDYKSKPAILATVIDITDRKRSEQERVQAARELEMHKAEFYKQAITAVTQGVLEIREPEEIRSDLTDPSIELFLTTAQNVSSSRQALRSLAEEAGVNDIRKEMFLLAVGEAAANALKHSGGGRLVAGVRDGRAWAAVVDQGGGMDTLLLTRAVFRKGFSTKPSLGIGYSLILEGADRVLLSTSPQGTTVVMEISIIEKPGPTLADLPNIAM